MVSREEITQAPRSRSGELSPTLMSGHRLSYKLSGLLVPALGLEEPGPVTSKCGREEPFPKNTLPVAHPGGCPQYCIARAGGAQGHPPHSIAGEKGSQFCCSASGPHGAGTGTMVPHPQDKLKNRLSKGTTRQQ